MKKIYLLLAIAYMFLSGCVVSKQLYYMTDEVKNEQTRISDEELAEIYETYRDQPAYYLKYLKSVEYHGQNGFGAYWNKTIIRRRKYIIIDPESDAYTSITMPSSSIEDSMIVKLTYPDGTNDIYTTSDFFREESSFSIDTYKLAFPRVVRGTIVDFYSRNTYAIYYPDVEQEYALNLYVPCRDYTFQFAIPDWWSFDVKKMGDSRYLNFRKESFYSEKKTVYEYHKMDVEVLADEIYSPMEHEISDYFSIMFTRFICGPYQYNNARSWASIAHSIRSKCINNDSWFSRRVSKTTDSLMTDSMTDKEKIEAINDFIHENIEVTTKFDDKNFSEILKTREGDYFSVTGLMFTMLQEADLDPKYVLVHSNELGYLDYKLPSISQTPFPAVVVQKKKQTYVLFPWLKYLAVDEIPEMFRNEAAIVVPAYANRSIDPMYSELKRNKNYLDLDILFEKGDVYFVKLPEGRIDKDYSMENYNITINDDGTMNVEEEKIIKGRMAYALRNMLEEIEDEKLNKELNKLVTYYDGAVETESVEMLNKDEYKKPLVIKLKYKVSNLVSVFEDEILFQTSGLLSSTSLTKYKIESEKRKNPIEIDYDAGFRKNIVITYPETWTIETELKNIDYSNKFGQVIALYKQNGNTLEIDQDVVLKKSSEPKEEFKELLNVMGKQSKLQIPTIIFRNNS